MVTADCDCHSDTCYTPGEYIAEGTRYTVKAEEDGYYFCEAFLDKFKAMKGQVYGWVYSKCFNDWSYCFLYWQNKTCQFVSSQVRSLRRLFHSSGFIHKWHGFHWNRKSKLARY